MRTKLPTTLLIAGLALLCAACTPTAPAAEEIDHTEGHNYLPETEQAEAYHKKQLEALQRAAQDCADMEWYATLKALPNRNEAWQNRYPISEEDAAVIRDLLLHKLHTVKQGLRGVRYDPVLPIRSKQLRFLDANGKIIYEFEFNTFGCPYIGKDSRTDANGYQYHTYLSMPDADCETWKKLIPDKMNEDLDKWFKEARKKFSRWGRQSVGLRPQ